MIVEINCKKHGKLLAWETNRCPRCECEKIEYEAQARWRELLAACERGDDNYIEFDKNNWIEANKLAAELGCNSSTIFNAIRLGYIRVARKRKRKVYVYKPEAEKYKAKYLERKTLRQKDDAIAALGDNEWLTTAQAAELLGVDKTYICWLARQDRIDARREANSWIVRGLSIKRLAAARAAKKKK